MMDDALASLAKNAYIFGYPMVYDVTEIVSQTTAPKIDVSAPINLYGHAQALATPADAFVSVNNDTFYSFVHCDVTEEPLVLHVPNTHDRYYVMQFIDAWSNNFAYVGRRATGTEESRYLLAGPKWSGPTPEAMTLIQAPTNLFSIIGRFAVNGETDAPNVIALQKETWVTPLSRYPELPVTEGRAFGDRTVAPWDERVPEELAFWEKLRSWMQLFPPGAGDAAFVESLAPLGLTASESPYVQADAELARILIAGANAGQEEIEHVMKSGGATPVNGWVSAMHAFDYNLDHFELGTIDAPEWKMTSRPASYLARAVAARGMLWGNHGYEAVYASVYVDDQNEQLTGAHDYVLHFDELPPVDAFWSLTMYDVPKFYLVANEINRFSIGDRTPGLQYNPDGSLDLYIQHAAPAAEKRSNWLPAPEGDFRPLMRMYQSRDAILNGSYRLPGIRRVR